MAGDAVLILVHTMHNNSRVFDIFEFYLTLEGQNCGFDPLLKKLSIKCSLVHHVLETIFKVGCKILRFFLGIFLILREM